MNILNTSKKFLKAGVCAIMLITAGQAQAQQVTVDASIDSLQLLIGEQAKVKLEISMDAKQKLQLPFLRDTLVKGVEILDIAKPDTQMLNDGKRMLIKREVPIIWDDVSAIVWLTLLMLALGGLAYYLFVRYKDNKPIIKKIKIEPKLPPHQQALKEIERIKGDKTLRTADPKTYYTELTDVLRTYMEERFGFNAMEMTSSEIIDKLQEINDKESIKDLMYLFQTADLVKFAKHSPLMNENDMNLVNAVDFINNTKVEPDPNAKPEPTEITVEEKRSKQGRMILLGSISIIVIAIVVILYKVLSGVYNLWF